MFWWKNWRIADETVESIQLKREILKTLGSDSVLYKLHRNNVKRLCRIDIERSIDQQHDIVQSQPPSQQYFEAIKRTKETSKSKRKCWNVKSESGKIITEREDVIKRWTEYYQKLYSDQRSNSLIRESLNDVDEIPSITYLELVVAIQQLNSDKAPGPDSIACEMFKYGGSYLHETLLILMNSIVKEQVLPEKNNNLAEIVSKCLRAMSKFIRCHFCEKCPTFCNDYIFFKFMFVFQLLLDLTIYCD